MNRINPLYLLIVFIGIFGFSLFYVNNMNKNYTEKRNTFTAFKNKATEYKQLKKGWHSYKEVQQKIASFSKDASFTKAGIAISFKGKLAHIKMKNTSKEIINRFLSKLLNEKLRINKLKITQTSVFVELVVK